MSIVWWAALIIIISTSLAAISGGGNPRVYKITCDSGYETEWSQWAFLDSGMISYRINGSYVDRKMLPGEICKRIKKRKND